MLHVMEDILARQWSPCSTTPVIDGRVTTTYHLGAIGANPSHGDARAIIETVAIHEVATPEIPTIYVAATRPSQRSTHGRSSH